MCIQFEGTSVRHRPFWSAGKPITSIACSHAFSGALLPSSLLYCEALPWSGASFVWVLVISGPAATKLTASCGMQVMEEKVTDVNVDAACVTPDGGFKLYSKAEVADIISRI